MKSIILVIIFLTLANNMFAQHHIIGSIRQSATNDRDFIHDASNDFTKNLGDALKAQYPSEIYSIRIKIDTTSGLLSLQCIADIRKCDSANADYVIEHAGALSVGILKNVVSADANSRSRKQGIVRYKIMSSHYGKKKVRLLSKNYVSTILYHKGWWSICERFVIAKK